MKGTSALFIKCMSIFFVIIFWNGMADCVEKSSLDDLKLLTVIHLKAETGHIQGIAVDEESMWVTSVNRGKKSGHLYRFNSKTGILLNQVEVQEGERYHPGGLSLDGENVWIPVAVYNRTGTSAIECRDKTTLKLVSRFLVDDHIGCIAVDGERLIGGNWDSVNLYFWDKKGVLLKKIDNPTHNRYQDMKCLEGILIASGLSEDKDKGVIDWIDLSEMKAIKQLWGGKTDRGDNYMEEGMEIHRDKLYLMPEDNPSRVFVYYIGEN